MLVLYVNAIHRGISVYFCVGQTSSVIMCFYGYTDTALPFRFRFYSEVCPPAPRPERGACFSLYYRTRERDPV